MTDDKNLAAPHPATGGAVRHHGDADAFPA
jgi:hypothetical protein